MLKRAFAALLAAVLPCILHGAETERSVVQILTFSQAPLWETPWRNETVRGASGSGFVIKGRRIMTNAHVVGWARQIFVRRYQDPRPYPARVLFAGHDCDLALLAVEDDSFFENLDPLEFGDLPQVRSTVVTCGYPAGGEQISYTRGVVSRIEMQTYAHAGNRGFLAVQTDAAINPGNSGGPVLQEDRVVGVAFQGIPGLENAGFFIPPVVVDHFLKDIEDGRYDGFPLAGVRQVPLQNPAYRRFLKLPNNDRGARIDGLLPIPSAQELLRPDDVLLRVGGYDVASDGSILYKGNRVASAVAFQMAQVGEKVPITLWREGREIELEIPMSIYEADRYTGSQYDVRPRYLVYGGLVFVPLSQDYLRTLGRDAREPAMAQIAYELYYRRSEAPQTARTEPVVLATTLSHPVNANFKINARVLVNRINGVRIDRLEDVAKALDANTNSHHVIEFMPDNALETLDKKDADAAHRQILATYGVPKDRSL